MKPSNWNFPWRFAILSRLCVAVVLKCMIGNPCIAADTVFVLVTTSTGNDTLVEGIEGEITFSVFPTSDTLVGMSLVTKYTFSNANVIGAQYDSGSAPSVKYSPETIAIFEARSFNNVLGASVTNPDTTVLNLADFSGSSRWQGEGEVYSIAFVPTDSSTISVTNGPQVGFPAQTNFSKHDGGAYETIVWMPRSIQVIHCDSAIVIGGDTNFDRLVNSSDIIRLVNFVFKSGEEPTLKPTGDIDCSGSISSADIILLVNFVFKSGAMPCNPCTSG